MGLLQLDAKPKDNLHHAIGRVMTLAFQINQEKSVSVFVDFSGHTRWLEIQICKSKADYHNELTRMLVRFDGDNQNNCENLANLIELLEQVLEFDVSDTDALQTLCGQHPANNFVY